MNRHQRRAERTTWRAFADVVAETVGFATPLHNAALEAAKGTAGAAEQFYELIDDLPVPAARPLWMRMLELEKKTGRIARQYVSRGRV